MYSLSMVKSKFFCEKNIVLYSFYYFCIVYYIIRTQKYVFTNRTLV